ncbi:MAG: flagellar hook-basal body complex protein FliE [Lachnospiraceae bacterium]|nr:flagellar hook-basal body complex protein FliE [Lachnospiraceae bacterium]
MDINSLLGTSSIINENVTSATQAGRITKTNSMFDTILNSAIDNINTTNSLLSDAENAEISFALGETENTHDLMIALQKATTALQYTVAIRDKFLDAYKEIMQMQI